MKIVLCAKQLGIKPVNDMLRSMGISEEEISGMSDSIDGMLENINENLPDDITDQDLTDGKPHKARMSSIPFPAA